MCFYLYHWLLFYLIFEISLHNWIPYLILQSQMKAQWSMNFLSGISCSIFEIPDESPHVM